MDFIKKRKAALFIFLMSGLHLFMGTILNLTDDEAYYWEWSRHLDISYYDHPPMIAYFIRFFTSIFGNNNFAVRLVPTVIIAITSIYIYKIIMYLYEDEKKGLIGVFIFNVIPIFAVLSLMALPDLPLMLFYTMGLYYFIRLINEKEGKLWYVLGFLTGLGLLSKYNMVLVYPGIFLYLLINKSQWFWFKKKELYLSFILSLAFFIPVILWNIQHDWVSFAFQFYGRHNRGLTLDFDLFGIFIATQLIVTSPILFIGFIKTIYKNFNNKDVKMLFFYGGPVFFIFMFTSFFTEFKLHWTALAFIPFLIIFTRYIKWNWFWKYFGVGLAIFLTLFLYTQSFYPVAKINPEDDITTDMHGWDKVGRQVQEIYNNVNEDRWFLFSNRYQLTSQLAFYLPEKDYVYSINNNIEQYDFWRDTEKLKGKNGLFITHTFYKIEPDKKYIFDKINLFKKIDITRAGRVYRTFYIYKCFNFKGVK